MKAIIEVPEFLAAIAKIDRVVKKKDTIPILMHVKIEVAANRLRLTGNNLEIEASTSVPVSDAVDGATTAPMAELATFVKLLPKGATVRLELASGRLTISSGRNRRVLPTLPTGDFPKLDAGKFPFRFDADILTLLRAPLAAVSADALTQPALVGVCLHETVVGGEPALCAVGTDGHRLIRFRAPLPSGASSMPALIIPTMTIAALAATEGVSTIEISPGLIRVTSGETVVTSKIIDGTFPDYERFIPAGNDRVATCDAAELLNAIEIANSGANDRSRALCLSLSSGSFTASNDFAVDGEAEAAIEIEYDAAPLHWGVNGKELADTLAAIGGDTICIAFRDDKTPALITSKTSSDIMAIMMPLRLRGTRQLAEAA